MKALKVVLAAVILLTFAASGAYAVIDKDLKTVQDYMNRKIGTPNIMEVVLVSQGVYLARTKVNNISINFTCRLSAGVVTVTAAVVPTLNQDLLAKATVFTNTTWKITTAALQDWKAVGGSVEFTFAAGGASTSTITTTIGASNALVSSTVKSTLTYTGKKLSAEKVETNKYDAQAKLAESKVENYTYGANGKAQTYTQTSSKYNADGTVAVQTSVNDTYFTNGKTETEQTATKINVYDANKKLKNVWTETVNATYHESGELESMEQCNYYYEGTKLIAKRREVADFQQGNGAYEGSVVELATYSYYSNGRLKEQDYAKYTYDASYNLTSKTVSNWIYDSTGKQTGGTTETINASDSIPGSSEILQKKSVENAILATAGNKLYSNQMAVKTPELPGSNQVGKQQ